MWEEILKQAKSLAERGIGLQSFADAGVSDKEGLKGYMVEREKYLDDVSKFLSDMPEQLKSEFDGVNAQLKSLKDSIKQNKTIDKEMTKKDAMLAFARVSLLSQKGIDAFSEKGVEELKRIVRPGALKTGNVVRHDFQGKDAVDANLIPGDTQAGYIILPAYMREMIKYLPEKSDLMGLVRTLPMIAPVHSYPVFSGRSITMTRTAATSKGTSWNKANKTAEASDGPSFGPREEIQATTLATYIPWIDEFEDDIQINESLAALMFECWQEAFGIDFDNNMLNADSSGTDQYDGLLKVASKQHIISSSAVAGMSPEELLNVPQKVSRMERNGLRYLLHETVLTELMKKKNAVGDYLFWTPPSGDKPARLGGYPYTECNQMPSISEIRPGDTFAALVNPDNMWYGEREGLEVKNFDGTVYGLEYQQNFVRYRLRNGFKHVKTDNAVLLKTRK